MKKIINNFIKKFFEVKNIVVDFAKENENKIKGYGCFSGFTIYCLFILVAIGPVGLFKMAIVVVGFALTVGFGAFLLDKGFEYLKLNSSDKEK